MSTNTNLTIVTLSQLSNNLNVNFSLLDGYSLLSKKFTTFDTFFVLYTKIVYIIVAGFCDSIIIEYIE